MATLRAVELFCGIGGVASAISWDSRQHPVLASTEIVAAVDIDRSARDTYANNWSHPTYARAIESLDARFFRNLRADLWWMSPPCQPFTRRGAGRDLADPRSAALRNIIRFAAEIKPRWLAMENVPPFRYSQARRLLIETLSRAGYTITERIICPTRLGIPCRRARYYLLAGRKPPRVTRIDRMLRDNSPRELVTFLDPQPDPRLLVDPEILQRYRSAIDLVDPRDPSAVASCFTSAYGRSPVRSGSYLKSDDLVRRFSPREILKLLGFPDSFQFPADLPERRQYALAGNSLSVFVVRRWLEQLTF